MSVAARITSQNTREREWNERRTNVLTRELSDAKQEVGEAYGVRDKLKAAQTTEQDKVSERRGRKVKDIPDGRGWQKVVGEGGAGGKYGWCAIVPVRASTDPNGSQRNPTDRCGLQQTDFPLGVSNGLTLLPPLELNANPLAVESRIQPHKQATYSANTGSSTGKTGQKKKKALAASMDMEARAEGRK
ncbi:hypothetical protein C8F01DRAFT_1080905 [Mycena amicta]|nr:hypothetical protein C8F01DRAFT_1080905 [Mycena amicta]